MAIVLVLVGPGWAQPLPVTSLRVEVLGEVDAPITAVREALLDLEGFGRWFPNTEQWQVLERTPGGALVYGRLSLPWPVDDRDYVARYSWTDSEGSHFTLRAEAVVDGTPRADESVVRVEEMKTTWELTPLGTGTRIRYVYQGSPGGFLPDWVARIGWEMQTGILMDALADELERRRKETEASAAAAEAP